MEDDRDWKNRIAGLTPAALLTLAAVIALVSVASGTAGGGCDEPAGPGVAVADAGTASGCGPDSAGPRGAISRG